MTNIYKKASKQKLRFQTNKGTISVEALWDLPLTHLDAIAMELNKALEEKATGSFLNPAKVDEVLKLKFELVKDVLQTRVDNKLVAEKAAVTRAQNARIDELIAKKQDEKLASLSIEELEALKN
ncbi:hypothetical protein [Vibrio phage vB_VhaP_PG11]|nr:hypothetical protein [Vibrio phage vB_VhaP_PG11]